MQVPHGTSIMGSYLIYFNSIQFNSNSNLFQFKTICHSSTSFFSIRHLTIHTTNHASNHKANLETYSCFQGFYSMNNKNQGICAATKIPYSQSRFILHFIFTFLFSPSPTKSHHRLQRIQLTCFMWYWCIHNKNKCICAPTQVPHSWRRFILLFNFLFITFSIASSGCHWSQ